MKKLWNNNRVLFFLLAILLVCFIAIIAVASTFFYSRNVSEYGDRIKDLDKHPVTAEVKSSFEEALLSNNSVKKVTFDQQKRTIYVFIDCDEKIKLEVAQKLVSDSLALFGEDLLGYYEFEFFLRSDNFTIIGAKNLKNTDIKWNNNRPVEEEETK